MIALSSLLLFSSSDSLAQTTNHRLILDTTIPTLSNKAPTAPTPAVKPVQRVLAKPELISTSRSNTTLASVPASNRSMSLEEADALLNYHQYPRVIDGMKQLIKDSPDNAQAWLLLAKALDGDNRGIEAAQARDKAAALGAAKQQRWHFDLKLAGLVDSNVVAAPNELTLAAKDQGDIGGTVDLNIRGKLLSSSLGDTQFSFHYHDMLYQDFNVYALRNLAGGLTQQMTFSSQHLQISVNAEQATLGNASLFAGYHLEIKDRIDISENHELDVSVRSGRRNFANAFSPFSAWRTQLSANWQTHQNGWKAGLGTSFRTETTQVHEEAFRSSIFQGSMAIRLFQPEPQESVWFSTNFSTDRRYYLNRDTRPFLLKPLTRQDRLYSLDGELKWDRPQTLWGSDIPESWFIQGGWMKNQSNFNQATTLTPANSRSWRRWWVTLGVLWSY